MGLYIVDMSSLRPSTLLNIMNCTYVGKCPITMFFLVQMGYNNNTLVPIFNKRLNMWPWRMHKWVDQFECYVSQFCLVVTIAMPMFYRSWNSFKWTWFKDLNLSIYMMHKIILQILKNSKSHGLLNSKLMDNIFHYHLFVHYNTVHWLMGCVLGIWN
jgi:hypothetical protein